MDEKKVVQMVAWRAAWLVGDWVAHSAVQWVVWMVEYLDMHWAGWTVDWLDFESVGT
jgi:hypothetical protein